MTDKAPLGTTDKATLTKAGLATASAGMAMFCGMMGGLMLSGSFNTASSLQKFAVSTQIVQQLDPAQNRQTLVVDWNKARQEEADSNKIVSARQKKTGKDLLYVATLGLIGFGAGYYSLRKKAGPAAD